MARTRRSRVRRGRARRRLSPLWGAARAFAPAAAMAFPKLRAGLRKRPGVKRKGFAPTRTGLKRRRKQPKSDLLQWQRTTKVTGRRPSSAVIRKQLVNAGREAIIYGFKHLKSFDDNGAVHIFSYSDAATGTQFLPCHMYLLNGRNYRDQLFPPGKSIRYSTTTGLMSTSVIPGVDGNGGYNNYLQLRYSSAEGSGDERKMYHEWTKVKMNLWGAKNKTVRFTVQLCSISSDRYNIFNPITDVTTELQQNLSEMMKHYTFNPIDKINWRSYKGFKVLRTFDTFIAPNNTDDGDADPQVKTLEWFVKRYRVTRFDTRSDQAVGLTVNNPVDFKTVTDVTENISSPSGTVPRDRDCLFLLVRASDFTPSTSTFNSAVHASYDIDFETRWSILQ